MNDPENNTSTLTTWLDGVASGITPYHLLVFLGCWLGGIFDGMDSSLYMVIQHDAIADILHTTNREAISTVGSYIMSTFLFGWMLGGICFGVVSDKFGRVTAMVLSILLYALFTGAAGFAHTPVQLAVCRFLTGFGIGGELVTIATMLSETWPEASRAFAVGMLITSYQVGVFLAGLIPAWVYTQFAHLTVAGEVVSPWRLVFLIGALPAVLAILLRLKLKESDKWLEAKEKEREKHTEEQAGKSGSGFWQQLSAIFAPAYRKDLLIGGAAFGGLLVGYWAALAWVPTWIQDMLGNTSTGTEKSIATLYHGLAAAVGCGISGVLGNLIGRRWTIMLGYLGAFLSMALLMLSNTVFSPAIYWQDALLGFFNGVSQAIMYVYLPELFPTRIRATAVGFCLNVGRFVTAIAVLFVGTLVSVFHGYALALLVFSTSYLVSVAAGYLGRETRGTVLPE